jgi:hypothetical protein
MRVSLAAMAAPMMLLVIPFGVSAQSVAPAASSTQGASLDTGSVLFSGSGPGETRTEPFTLEPGDFRLTYAVHPAGEEPDCGMGLALLAPDGSYYSGIGGNGAEVAAGEPYRNETWFYIPTAGSYVLEMGGDCDWDVTLASMPSPLGSAPITLTGSGPGMSPSFALGAGDHTIRYRATNPSSAEACIFFGPGIIHQAAVSEMQGDPVDAVVDPGATLEGEVSVPGLPEGRYGFVINNAWCSSGLAESISWEVTIDPS